jgi:hypothetical protein
MVYFEKSEKGKAPQNKKKMLTEDQRSEFGKRFSALLIDLLTVHQDPDTCALRAHVEAMRMELKSEIAAIELTPGPQGERGEPGPEGPEGPRGQEAPTSDEVVSDVMSVMESALNELRSLAS